MTDDPRKTLLNEVLPAPPTPSASTSVSVRARAQGRLETLAKKAALAGAAGTLSACVGYGVVDPIPTPAQCTQNDSLDLWLFASFSPTGNGTQIALTLSLNTFDVAGVRLSSQFVVDGGVVVGNPRFDGVDLASSNNVTVTIAPDAGVATLAVHTGVTCDETPRAVDVIIDTLQGTATVVDAAAGC